MGKVKEDTTIELDISHEEYFIINEAARKKGMLLDDYINEVLQEYMDKNKV